VVTDLHRGTVTFLFTDIEGSTALLKLLGGERYHDVLVEHQRLLRAAFEEAGGREVDTQGDAFFVAFQKARDALTAAVAAQRALAAQAWPDDVAVRVRMGLDTGEPVVGKGRYVGLGVHRTARIMAAAHGGQVLVSRTTRDLVRDELPAGTSLRDLGEQRLKDLDHPVHLFQVVASDLPAKFPKLRTLDSGPRARLLRLRVVGPAAAVAIGGVVAAIVLAGGSGGGVTVVPNSLGLINPRTNKVIGQVPVGIRPGSVAVGSGSVWVANEEDKTLSRIDGRTRRVLRTIALFSTPTGVATAKNAVWVAEGAAGALARVDPSLDEVTKTFDGLAGRVRVSGGPKGSVAIGGGSVWVTYGSTAVARINPASNSVIATGFAGFGASAIAYGEKAVWVANAGDNTVSRFSPETNRKVVDINVGRGPGGVAVGGGSVWVTDTGDDAVSRIDPQSRSVTTIPVGKGPLGIAYGDGGIWVANGKDGTVSRIDPRKGAVVKTIKVGGRPTGIYAGERLIWVTVEEP
jgi:YVTN family beta-propeller protein